MFKIIMKLIAPLLMKWAQKNYHPKVKKNITYSLLHTILEKTGCQQIFISDKKYVTTTKETIEEFLDLMNYFRFRQYVPEKYDCDNYSFNLMGQSTYFLSGYAVGIVWARTPKGNHALNFFIDQDQNFWYIEPQTNKIFQNKNFKPYFIVV